MANVTQRIKAIKRPARFIKPTSLSVCQLKANEELYPMEQENINPTHIGLAVDYLTRFSLGADTNEAFAISIGGAAAKDMFTKSKSLELVGKLLPFIEGLDDISIAAAYKLVTFDTWARDQSQHLCTGKRLLKKNPINLLLIILESWFIEISIFLRNMVQ